LSKTMNRAMRTKKFLMIEEKKDIVENFSVDETVRNEKNERVAEMNEKNKSDDTRVSVTERSEKNESDD